MLSPQDFSQLVRLAPLVSIDLIIRDPQNRALLGLRKNQPAKDFWFAPGGRIDKNERLDDAFRRLTHAELGTQLQRSSARFLGIYEHFYDTNFSGGGGFGTHYIALAHEIHLTKPLDHLPADQHHDYRWLTDAQILADPKVHKHTKDYFHA